MLDTVRDVTETGPAGERLLRARRGSTSPQHCPACDQPIRIALSLSRGTTLYLTRDARPVWSAETISLYHPADRHRCPNKPRFAQIILDDQHAAWIGSKWATR